jgi:hypothetical protein
MIASLLEELHAILARHNDHSAARSALFEALSDRLRGLHPALMCGTTEPVNGYGTALDELSTRYAWTLEEVHDVPSISPAILGRLYEMLLAERESSGSFYTPPHLARVMCQWALLGVLEEQTPISRARLEPLVQQRDCSTLSPRERDSIVGTLASLRCVDPACGAGALLVQMFAELSDIARVLQLEHAWIAAIPRRSLFGADLDPQALQIARLRLEAVVVSATETCADDFADNFADGDSLAGPSPEAIDAAASALPAIPWRERFAAVFAERGGFDIVLANPPYLRRERMPVEQRLLRTQYDDAVSGRADLFCYFYVRGLQLLREGGLQVFLCSNSWLDAGYGAGLQRWLLERAHVQAIIEPSAQRHFDDADVNTIISVIRKGRPTDDAPTQFVAERGAAPSDASREVTVSRAELWRRGRGDGEQYAGEKWGGLYLRAPRVFHRLLERSAGQLRKLSELADVIGYIHDNNTGDEFPPAPFVKSVRDLDCVALDAHASAVTAYGVNPAGNSRLVAPILFPRTFGARHLVAWNRAGIHAKEFYRVLPRNSADIVPICAQLNSTLGMLQREIIGLANLGEGALKFSARDVGLFDLIGGLTEAEIGPAFVQLSERPQLPPAEELQEPDRLELDRCLFQRLGLTRDEQTQIYEAVLALIADRAARAARNHH